MNVRLIFILLSSLIFTLNLGIVFLFGPEYALLSLLWAPIVLLGIKDLNQRKHTILRNFPIIGHFRYLLEAIRPEINQYFIESNSNGTPFSREQRSVVYQRSKQVLDTLPFGTQKDLYEIGTEWVSHSMHPKGHHEFKDLRVKIGSKDCKKPYSASILNISAMSYGALSSNAVTALNWGARMGHFAHNTGEGGISTYHQKHKGDLIWQIGTGYFGCRTEEGRFCPEIFKKNAQKEYVKMIEIKLSQGAKPGHGGILPAVKLTKEIAEIRGVKMGRDIISPSGHSEFSNPNELLEFITKLRELSGGKPIGIKLCVGKRTEILELVKAMHETQITPDYIVVDGAEGGTGAAPIEFSNSMGLPLKDALVFVHNTLVGFKMRDQVKIIASGKLITGFDIIACLSIGADLCYSARAMMMALGCIQALRCNSNECPAGVATQKDFLVEGLDISSKAERVYSFHRQTIKSILELLGAMGLDDTKELEPKNVMRRTSFNTVENYQEIYDYLSSGDLLVDVNKLPSYWKQFF